MAKSKSHDHSIGTVISDGETPTFETVRIKLKAGQDVKPGTMLKMHVTRKEKTILVARVRSGCENDPSKSVENVAVSDVLTIPAPHLSEENNPSAYRIIEADLIEEIYEELIEKEKNGKSVKEKIEAIRSPQNLPNSGADVFIADSDVIVKTLGIKSKPEDGLHLGKTVGGIGTEIILKKESIQRHFFIGGTTGSGKSYAMGVLAEELMKHNLPVIFIDTQDEYSAFVQANGGLSVKPGDDFNIRISSFTEVELFNVLPSVMQKSELQSNIVLTAFNNLKIRLRSDEIPKFRIANLIQEIPSVTRSLYNSKAKGEEARERDFAAKSDDIIRRLERIRDLRIFGAGVADWRKLMFPCLSINCRDLVSSQLQPMTTAVLRELQELRMKAHIPPYVVVIDEAHLFVPQGEGSPCKQIIREGVRIGRHHGICMILMTQSPVDIDKSIIRQCNTRMVFALEPDQLDAIKGVKADATDEMLRALPKMPQGTCLISGTYESMKHAIPVKIRKRSTENSEGGKTPNIFKDMKEKWIPKIEKLKEGES